MVRSNLLSAFTGLLFCCFLNWNCTKIDTTSIGSNLIPAVDNVNTFDTSLAVISNNMDSVSSNCSVIYPGQENVLGYISNDPIFGTTKATIYTELKPSSFPFSWPAVNASMSLDSIVLILSYKRTYGDSTKPQKVDVYQIANAFTPDSSSCSSYPISSTSLGSKIFTPQRLQDSIKGKFDSTSYQLRIPLSKTFGQSLLAQDTSKAFKSDSLFKAFFKGFAIVPDANFSGSNALTYYNLTDSNTKLSVYFTYKRTGLADTSVVNNFRVTTGLTATANNIVRNHTNSELAKFNISTHPVAGDSLIYIQTTPGTSAELRVPGFFGLSNRIIHRAELIMDQVYSATDNKYFTTPNYLFLDLKDTNKVYRPIPCDFSASTGQPDNLVSFGGFKTLVKNANGDSISRYTFNLTRYIQKIVTKAGLNLIMRLRAPDYVTTTIGYLDECGLQTPPLFFGLNELTVGRVKLGGGSNTLNKMRLRIIYSKL